MESKFFLTLVRFRIWYVIFIEKVVILVIKRLVIILGIVYFLVIISIVVLRRFKITLGIVRF